MSVNTLVTTLSVIFAVSIVALAGELLYILWCRRSFRRHSSPPPPIGNGVETPDFSSTDPATKEQLYLFCLKPHTRVDPSGAPNKNSDGSSPDDQVIDVFKLLEANGLPRFLCTIKEEDKEDVESTADVDFTNKPTTKNVNMQSCLQLAEKPAEAEAEEEDEEEEEEEVVVTVKRDDGDTKTVFSTPCDSPFFTPAGSPSREFMESEFVVSVHITGKTMIDDEGKYM